MSQRWKPVDDGLGWGDALSIPYFIHNPECQWSEVKCRRKLITNEYIPHARVISVCRQHF